MKVLIVDDHVLFREGLVSLLHSQPDIEVVGQAGTVQETLAQVSLVCPDLILMDFSLPDGTGLDATRAILAEHPGIKIVFLTVYETDDKLLAAIRGGARGYLLKNVPIARLLAALRSVEKGEAALSRAMTSRLMEEFARTAGGKPGPPDGFERLSRREMEVLQAMLSGTSNREIARDLFISENTVKHHIHNILAKLGLENRHQAIRYARQHGLK